MKVEIYIVFSDTKTVLSKSIQRFTSYPYCHTSLAFDSELREVYSFGRKRPTNPFIGGFAKEDFRNPFFGQADCEIYSCKVSDSQFQNIQDKVRVIENTQHFYGYNFLGLFGVLFQKPVKRHNRFFCTEFVAEVLTASGVSLASKSACLLKPEELARSSELHLVYRGTLAAYTAPDPGQEESLTPADFFSRSAIS